MTHEPAGPGRPLLGGEGADLTGVECRILRASLGLERRHVARFAEILNLSPVFPSIERVTAWEKSKGRGYPFHLREALQGLEEGVEAWACQAVDETAGAGEAVLYRPLGYRHAFALLEVDRYGLRFTADQLAALDIPNGELWLALADAAIARAAVRLRDGGQIVRVELDRDPDGPIRPDPARQAAPPAATGFLMRLAGNVKDAGPALAKVMDDMLVAREEPWVARLAHVASETLGPSEADIFVASAGRWMRGLTPGDRDTVATRLAQALVSGRLTTDELFSIGDRAPVLARAIVLEMNGGRPGVVKMNVRADIPADVITKALLRPDPTA